MLYDGAIKYLNQAKEKIAAKDYAAKGMLISKAIDVISELDESLNAQKGGQIAENLHSLYFYCNTRLLQANMSMDPKIIDEVLQILESIRAAFIEISGAQAAENLAEQAQASAARTAKPQPSPQAPPPPPGPLPQPGIQPPPAPKRESTQSSEPEQQGQSGSRPAPGKIPGTYGRMGGYK